MSEDAVIERSDYAFSEEYYLHGTYCCSASVPLLTAYIHSSNGDISLILLKFAYFLGFHTSNSAKFQGK